jgi:cellobiose phosphorylase
MYQAAVKAILGLERRGETISINPCVPTVWETFSLDWTIGSTHYHFVMSNPQHSSRGIATAELDGVAVDPSRIPLLQDGRRHDVRVVLGSGVKATAS